MTAAPLVSIVIPAFSPGALLAETVASVAAQAHRPIEIVIADDGSPEPVRPVSAGDIPVTVLRLPHRGVSAARNAALARARGELVTFLDADDVWTANALRLLLRAREAAPGCAAVHGQVQMFRHGTSATREHLRTPYFGFNLGSILIERAAARRIGGFDESLAFGEDVDFLVRLQESGARRHPFEGLVLLYRRGHGGVTERANLAFDPRANVRNWARVLAANLARRRKAAGGSMSALTAIVAVRDGERFVGSALESIAAQTVPVAEILVLDGGSSDRTCALAAAFAKVRIVPQAGGGLAAARNQALAAATGDIVAFLDHDDLWTPRKIETQLALLRQGKRPGMVVGALRLFRGGAAGGAPEFEDAPRLARTPGVLLADRAVFDRVGGFDTALGSGCDMDWFARAALANIPTAATDEVVLLKRLHEANLSRDSERNRREAFAVLAKLQARRRSGS